MLCLNKTRRREPYSVITYTIQTQMASSVFDLQDSHVSSTKNATQASAVTDLKIKSGLALVLILHRTISGIFQPVRGLNALRI